ncbi:MAG: serine/threonine protein kinase [Verrucomicrobiales bacterium]|nr:serine/threonine protein kinase [Verrucomicrobiales bacterium]
MPSSQERESALFALALEKPLSERSEFLRAVCGSDPALRQRLESLLAAHDEPDALLPEQAKVVRGTMKIEFADEPGDEAVGQTLGRYKLLERVGEGGCGVVYVAEQTEPVRRRVALKVIKLGMDTKQVVARFEAERQALAMMDHPNIAKVLDAGTTDVGRPFFVMELVRGIRITDYCDQANLTTKERLDLFIKVCQAIQHAHQKGIIHRDIKPSNILVTLHDGVPVPKVIDFGIAKATEGRLTDNTVYTQLHQFIGTPAYMSPEQAEMSGLDIDTRSDIYSLGVLLYELLAGSTPFDPKELMASGIDAMRKTIREKEPQRPSTRVATLGADQLTTTAKRRSADTSKLLHQLKGDLDWIVMKCLEKDRQRRYDTANGLAADLKRHLNNEPVVARPPSAAYKFQKAFRRNKLAFAAATVVLGALIAGLGLAAVGLRQAVNERNRALAAQASEQVQRRQAQQAQSSEAQLRHAAELQELAARRRAYASDMNLAQQSISANNFGRAVELLNRHRPATRAEIDLRGWEWRYLWQFCQGDDLFTLCRQTDSVFSLSASRDGRWLAIGEFSNGKVSLWDLRTRQEIASPAAAAATQTTTHLLFSPRDPLLAYSSATQASNAIQLWSAEAQRIVGTLPLDGPCLGLTFSEDGRRLATFTRTVTLWSIPDGQKLSTVAMSGQDFTMGLSRFSTSRDLSSAAYGMFGGLIRVVDLTTGRERWSAKAASEWVIALAFSPDGKTLASTAGYAEGTIKLWDVATGRELGRLEGHQGWVSSIVFWPDGKKLASAGADQTIRLWDLENPAQARPVGLLRGHNAEVWDLALLPDNVTLISGGKDGSVRAWDTTKKPRTQTAATLAVKVRRWHFAADSKSLICLDTEGRVTRWYGESFQDEQRVSRIERPLPFSPDIFLLSRDGHRTAVGSTNGTVQLWDSDRGTLIRELSTQPGVVLPLNFVQRGDGIILHHEDDSIREWNFSSGRQTQLWQAPDRQIAWALSADERWFAAFAFNGTSILQDRSSGAKTDLRVNLREASAATFSPDAKSFAVVSWTGIGKVWSLEPLRELGTLRGFLQGIDSVVFSPDGSRLAAGSGGKEALKLYDTASYQELLTLEADGSGYRDTEFSPDGSVLAALSGPGVPRLWRAPSWDEIAAAEAKEKTPNQQP